ncbi:protein S100-A13-like [Podarcis raffonei]|uniref:protein S100-A13-like n=1 Tax=Podarcis raffonei TaxID=65483 RepID=UPI00232994E4|nr:protein S100-A13-like [Podarcis raffonei]
MASEGVSEMKMAIDKIVSILLVHTVTEGKKETLTAGQFKVLVNKQLPNFMKDAGDLDEKMRSLGTDSDGELEFTSYWKLMTEISKKLKEGKMGNIK